MNWNKLIAAICVVVVGLSFGGAVIYGMWWGFSLMPHGSLAAYALVVTWLLPAFGYGGYRAAKLSYNLGKKESDGVIAGIGLGAGPVAQMAEKVANVKIGTTRALRQPDPILTVDLPEVIDVTPRLQSGKKVIL